MSAKPNTSLNERTKHSSSTFMDSVSVPSMSNMTRCMGSGLTRIRRNYVASISAVTQAMFGIKGMHRSISYLRLMVVARQLIHGSGLGGAEQDYRTRKQQARRHQRDQSFK